MARHPLTFSLDVMEGRSNPVPESVIESYRQNGDPVVGQWIIRSYTLLAIGMAGTYARRLASQDSSNQTFEDRFHELSAVACLALTQATYWCGPHLNDEGVMVESRLHDNEIEPYLKTTIKGWIRKSIEKDRAVFMPGRTFRAKVARGELDPDGRNTNPELVGVVSVVRIAEDDFFDGDEEDEREGSALIAVPLARRETPELELEDALQLAIRTSQERRVIDLRREGYTYQNLADVLDLSVSRIGQIVAPVEERFFKLYA